MLSSDIPDSTIQIQIEEKNKNPAEFEIMLNKEKKTEPSNILSQIHLNNLEKSKKNYSILTQMSVSI